MLPCSLVRPALLLACGCPVALCCQAVLRSAPCLLPRVALVSPTSSGVKGGVRGRKDALQRNNIKNYSNCYCGPEATSHDTLTPLSAGGPAHLTGMQLSQPGEVDATRPFTPWRPTWFTQHARYWIAQSLCFGQSRNPAWDSPENGRVVGGAGRGGEGRGRGRANA